MNKQQLLWTSDLTAGSCVFIKNNTGLLFARHVTGVSERKFLVEGIQSSFNKTTACNIEGTQAYPDRYDIREKYSLQKQREFLVGLDVCKLTGLQIKHMLAGLSLARKAGDKTKYSHNIHADAKNKILHYIQYGLSDLQVIYLLASLSRLLNKREKKAMSLPKAKQNKGSRRQSKLSTEELTQSKEVALSLVANQRLVIFWGVLGLFILTCLGILLLKQKTVKESWDLGELVNGISVSDYYTKENNYLTTTKSTFMVKAIFTSFPGTKVRMQQHYDGHYYICGHTAESCFSIPETQGVEIRQKILKADNKVDH
ncbi:hypothetical protein [Photorhabdus asymbiotica]|uniref:hypothetical protein n=1 Tax=Photorhabdus asymbiotica TaxID=291112 RepID=UPI003DA75D35